MGLKENLQRRIEKDCIKSELNGEVVYLKRSRLPLVGDWGRIYPPINEDGKINWINTFFGGKTNFFRFLFIMLCLVMTYLFIAQTLGANKEYFSGDYVIVEKGLFTQYCKVGVSYYNLVERGESNFTLIKDLNKSIES